MDKDRNEQWIYTGHLACVRWGDKNGVIDDQYVKWAGF
jgi:hypothetical protein